MKKNLIAFTLILCLVFSSLPIYAAEKSPKVDIKKIDSQIMLKMTSATKTNSGTSDAFYIGNVFICTEKINDNTFEYAYNTGDKIYYKRVENNVVVEDTVEDNNVQVTSASTEQIEALEKVFENNDLSESEMQTAAEKIGFTKRYTPYGYYYAVNAMTTKSSGSSTYYGGIDELQSTFPPLDEAYSSTLSRYCSALKTSKNVIVRDTRTNYVATASINKYFSVGFSIVKVAAQIWAHPDWLRSWLGIGSTVTSIIEACTVYRYTTAQAYRYRFGHIYDSTSANAYVKCGTEWGHDYYVVSRQNDSDETSYAWGVSPDTFKEIYPDSTIADGAMQEYNHILETYGEWRWL